MSSQPATGRRSRTVKLGFTRVYGADRVMWFTERDRPSSTFVETLERIGADPKVVEAARQPGD